VEVPPLPSWLPPHDWEELPTTGDKVSDKLVAHPINKANYPVGNRPAPPKGFRNREQHTAYYTSVINCLQDVWCPYLTALDIQQKPVSLVAYDVDVIPPVAPKDRVRRPSTVPPMPPSTYRGTFTSSKRKTGFTQATP
jgi:hypothetical protein